MAAAAAAAESKVEYTAMLLGATGNVGGHILHLLVQSPLCKKVVVVTRRNVESQRPSLLGRNSPRLFFPHAPRHHRRAPPQLRPDGRALRSRATACAGRGLRRPGRICAIARGRAGDRLRTGQRLAAAARARIRFARQVRLTEADTRRSIPARQAQHAELSHAESAEGFLDCWLNGSHDRRPDLWGTD